MKERTVSRTITSLNVECLCVDVASQETFTQKEAITGKYKNDGEILKVLKERIEPENKSVIVAGIIGKEKTTMKYSMSEVDFIKNAEIVAVINEAETEEIEETEETAEV